MSIRKGNVIIAFNAPEYHRKKLDIICSRLGITKSEALKRMIEAYELFPNQLSKRTLGDIENE